MNNERYPLNNQRLVFPIIFIVISLFAVICISLRNYFPVPNTNFFAYAEEGKAYITGKVPDTVKLSPVYPILISIPGLFIHTGTTELTTGIYLNIFFITVSLYLLYLYLKKIDQDISIPVVIILASNFLSFVVAIQPVNTAAFVFMVILVFILDVYTFKHLPMFAAGAGYLIRPESLALLFALYIKNIIKTLWNRVEIQKKKNEIIQWTIILLFSLIPSALWEVFAYYHNTNTNDYILEISRRINEIPNWSFVFDTLTRYLFYSLSIPKEILLFFVISLALFCTVLLFRGIYQEFISLFLFSFFYLLMHIFFPVAANRYSYPMLFVSYILLFTPILYLSYKHIITIHQKRIAIGILSCILIFINIQSLPKNFTQEKKYREEIQLVSHYIGTNTFKEKTVILMPEPWIGKYYNKNPHLIVTSAPTGCIHIPCLFTDNTIKSAKNVLLILDSHTARMLDQAYFRNFPHAAFFNYFNETIAPAILPMYSSRLNESWIRVYSLIPESIK